MSIKKLPSYHNYWSPVCDLHDHFISSLINVNRFGWLLGHIHLNDNSIQPKKDDLGYEKLYKICPLLTVLG